MKLVRENIAKRILAEDATQISQASDNTEFLMFLKLKLSEELDELRESNYSDVNEFADVLEVLETLAEQHGLSFSKILEAKHNKAQVEGDLKRGLIYKKLT